jgi:hypothetical protein
MCFISIIISMPISSDAAATDTSLSWCPAQCTAWLNSGRLETYNVVCPLLLKTFIIPNTKFLSISADVTSLSLKYFLLYRGSLLIASQYPFCFHYLF